MRTTYDETNQEEGLVILTGHGRHIPATSVIDTSVNVVEELANVGIHGSYAGLDLEPNGFSLEQLQIIRQGVGEWQDDKSTAEIFRTRIDAASLIVGGEMVALPGYRMVEFIAVAPPLEAEEARGHSLDNLRDVQNFPLTVRNGVHYYRGYDHSVYGSSTSSAEGAVTNAMLSVVAKINSIRRQGVFNVQLLPEWHNVGYEVGYSRPRYTAMLYFQIFGLKIFEPEYVEEIEDAEN
jgi:hypothetical protein